MEGIANLQLFLSSCKGELQYFDMIKRCNAFLNMVTAFDTVKKGSRISIKGRRVNFKATVAVTSMLSFAYLANSITMLNGRALSCLIELIGLVFALPRDLLHVLRTRSSIFQQGFWTSCFDPLESA